MIAKVNVKVVSSLSCSNSSNSNCSVIQSDFIKIESLLNSLNANDAIVESFNYEAYVE